MTDASQLPDSKTVTLKETIDFEGKSFTTITLQEPTAGQIEDARRSSGETAVIRLIALCSGTPEAVVRQLKARNYREAGDFVTSFF